MKKTVVLILFSLCIIVFNATVYAVEKTIVEQPTTTAEDDEEPACE